MYVHPGSCAARDAFVLRKVRAATGDRMRTSIALSGDAAINRNMRDLLLLRWSRKLTE